MPKLHSSRPSLDNPKYLEKTVYKYRDYIVFKIACLGRKSMRRVSFLGQKVLDPIFVTINKRTANKSWHILIGARHNTYVDEIGTADQIYWICEMIISLVRWQLTWIKTFPEPCGITSMFQFIQGPYLISVKSREVARLDAIMPFSLYNVTGILAALLLRCLSNFRTIGKD